MKSKLILLDQDGVLADFDLGFRQQWHKKYAEEDPLEKPRRHFYLRDELPHQYHQQLHDVMGSIGFFANLPPINGAIEAAKILLKVGHDVRICTSPIHDYHHCVNEKFDWVVRYLGEEWIERMIITKDKTWVRADILIDDKPKITGSLTPLWHHWIYNQPYNQLTNHTHRVTWQEQLSWQELVLENDGKFSL